MIPWLCTSIASPHRPRGKRSSPVPESRRKKSSSREITRQICKNYSRTFSFNWFCLLFCWVVTEHFSIESVWENQGQYPRDFSKGKEAWEHFSFDHISKKTVARFPSASITKPFSGPKSEKSKNWYKKVKEEGRTCQERKELLRWRKKAVFWRKEKKFHLQKPKKLQIKRPKPKINCLPPLTKTRIITFA